MMDQDDIEDISDATDQTTPQDQINISDVIEVIQTTDPTAQAMFNNVTDVISTQSTQLLPEQNATQQRPSSGDGSLPGSIALNNSNHNLSNTNRRRNAYVKITEQPASKALRFRYECEGRSAGSIPGVYSTPENKTFPSIQVVGYRGRAVVVVSCVTKDPPYRPHPHNLVGKEGCKKGVCTVEINSDTMSVTFSNLGIQCVKKRDIEEALRVREEIRVDPYRTGFTHRSQPSSIDLNSVRLCFQVFLESDQRGRFTVPLTPVVSDPIFDKKAMSDLVICKLSDASCTVVGGKEMILLCEKVAKEDISVRFFEEQNGNLVWEGYGDFQHTNVHKQVAISFRTPRYKSLEIEHSVKCYIQLKRPSDGVTSEALPFEYLPLDSDTIELKRKRIKIGNESNLYKQLRSHEHQLDGRLDILNITDPTIKTEPSDNLNPSYHAYGNSMNPSTQPLSMSPGHSQHGSASTQNVPHNIQEYKLGPINFSQYTQSYQIGSSLQQQPSYQLSTNPFNITLHQSNETTPSTLLPTLNNLNTSLSFNAPTQPEVISSASPNITTNVTESNTANLSSLLDMDSQQFTHINSAELTGLSLSLLDGTYSGSVDHPTDSVKQDLAQTQMDQDNMTDSFTRFATDAIKELNDLNNIYNNSANNNKHVN